MATEKTDPTDGDRTHGDRAGTQRVSGLAGLVAGVRDDLRIRRADRAERRRLETELATYRTTAERDDLMAMLDRYDDDQVREIRRILDRHHAA